MLNPIQVRQLLIALLIHAPDLRDLVNNEDFWDLEQESFPTDTLYENIAKLIPKMEESTKKMLKLTATSNFEVKLEDGRVSEISFGSEIERREVRYDLERNTEKPTTVTKHVHQNLGEMSQILIKEEKSELYSYIVVHPEAEDRESILITAFCNPYCDTDSPSLFYYIDNASFVLKYKKSMYLKSPEGDLVSNGAEDDTIVECRIDNLNIPALNLVLEFDTDEEEVFLGYEEDSVIYLMRVTFDSIAGKPYILVQTVNRKTNERADNAYPIPVVKELQE